MRDDQPAPRQAATVKLSEHEPMDDSRDNRNGRFRRHCMVVHAYYPVTETRVEREAKALLDEGIEVDVICLRQPHELPKALVEGVTVHRLPVRRHRGKSLFVQLFEYIAFFVLVFGRLTRLHWRRRYDEVQVHNLPDFLVFAALIPKLMGARIILDLHDLMPEFYAERHDRAMDHWLVRLIRWQESLSCRFADHVITVTELWRQSLIHRGQPADKITVVMNVADDRIFRPATAPLPRNGHFQLIYHGVLGQRHGLDIALKAIDQVRSAAPDIQFLIHGWGEYSSTLHRLVQQMALQDHVTFSTAELATSDLPKLLETANLAIVPYRNGVFTGGILPTKLMEYAALGIPVVAARTPGIAAYFDERTVRLFSPGDVDELASCILTLYTDRPQLEELSQNIRRFNDRYSWKQVSAQYKSLIRQLGN
jgi:glycosyltransferase involved in cell wall biosynthesis